MKKEEPRFDFQLNETGVVRSIKPGVKSLLGIKKNDNTKKIFSLLNLSSIDAHKIEKRLKNALGGEKEKIKVRCGLQQELFLFEFIPIIMKNKNQIGVLCSPVRSRKSGDPDGKINIERKFLKKMSLHLVGLLSRNQHEEEIIKLLNEMGSGFKYDQISILQEITDSENKNSEYFVRYHGKNDKTKTILTNQNDDHKYRIRINPEVNRKLSSGKVLIVRGEEYFVPGTGNITTGKKNEWNWNEGTIVLSPIINRKRLLGVLKIEIKDSQRIISNDEMTIIKLVSSALGSCLAGELFDHELRESKEKYKNILKSIQDVYFRTDIDGNIIFISPSIIKITGYTPAKYLGKNITNVLEPAKPLDLLSTIKMYSEIHEFEIRLKNIYGKKLWIALSAKIVHDEDGKNTGFDGFIKNITDRRKIFEQIRKLSISLEQSPVSVILTNTKGEIEFVNKKFTEVTGYSFMEVIGKNPRILKSGEYDRSYYKNLWQTITSGSAWYGELHNRRKNGELFWESASISPVKDTKGELIGYVAVKEDITEKKKFMDELIEAKHVAEKADRLKSGFIAQISHEIRSPLNVLINFSTLIKEKLEGNSDPEFDEAFFAIDTSGKRIIRTIDMMLNMSILQSGSYESIPEWMDIENDILSKVVSDYKSEAVKKDLDLVIEKRTKDLRVQGDRYSLTQVFNHLVENAIKYTNEGSVKTIIKKNSKGELEVSVTDTGIGIKERYLPYIFNPFTQEMVGYSRRYEGNGLGLALVKKYCDINNLFVDVKSKKGEGTKFTVTFPAKMKKSK